MRNVSEAYKQNATDTSKARAAKAMVEFCIVESAGEYSEECSPYYGFTSQIFDEENEKTDWATCEPGRMRLNGSMCIPNYTDKFKYGYISQAMSDAAGLIDITLKITFVGTRASKGITICFQEPVHDFSLKVGEDLYIIEGNTSLQCYIDHEEEYESIELHITKLGAYRRVRISQIFLGAVMSYEDEKIINLSAINEVSLDNTKLPADSVTFSLVNEANEFDMLNPHSLYKYLKENQPVNVHLGIKVDGIYQYARIGRYFVDSWSTKGMKATFNTYSAIFSMDEDEYRLGRIELRTLYEMLAELLDDVGLAYEIDEELKRLTVSGYIPLVSKREAMRQMIQTGCCMAKSDSRGRIIIMQREEEPGKPNEYAIIDGANLKDWPEMKQKKNYASAEVTINRFKVAEEESELYSGTALIITGKLLASGKYQVWVPYKQSPAKDVTISGAEQYEAYACGAYVYIEKDTPITITGKKVTVEQESYVKHKYNYDNPTKISNNLVISENNAEKIADYALTELDMTATASYTGFPHLEAGDASELETQYGDKRIFLTKNTLEYSGALSGKVEGAGKVG